MYQGDAYWRDRFPQQCTTAGFRPDIGYEVAQLSALLGLVEAGAGRAFASVCVHKSQRSIVQNFGNVIPLRSGILLGQPSLATPESNRFRQ
jgi:DNA-binding transcriptional LysR family regulator